MPLTYNPARVVIVAASSPNRLQEECDAYNVAIDAPGLRKVYVPDDLPAVLSLPPDTPWCVVGGTSGDAYVALTRRFGMPQTFADAMYVIEVDVAIRPELLR